MRCDTKKTMHRPVRHRLALVTAIVASALTACGSGAEDSGPDDLQPIRVAVIAASTGTPQIYVAQELGYFDDEGLEVTIDVAGATLVQSVVTGTNDLALASLASAVTSSANGKQMTVVYQSNGGGLTAWTATNDPAVQALEDCTRMASGTAASSNVAWANYLGDQVGADFDIVPLDSTAAMVAALASGQVDCANGSAGGLSPAVAEGKARWILRPDDPATLPDDFPADLPEVNLYGLDTTVSEIGAEIEAFIRAMLRAQETMATMSDAELAELFAGIEAFSEQSVESLEQQMAAARTGLTTTEGHISETAWQAGLDWLTAGGVDPAATGADAVAYENMVDLSYVTAARSDLG